MALRSRGRGPSLWAAILAVYALLLHAPAMAAMGHSVDGIVATSASHDHGQPSAPVAAPASAEDHATGEGDHGRMAPDKPCCTVCAGGTCAVGPVNSGVLALPVPLARARRFRLALRRQALRPTQRSWFEARGPPTVV